MEWLDKIETMLSIITSKITGTTVLTGDTSINVNEPSRPKKRYQEILENFNLDQHINLPTRKEVRSLTILLQTFQTKYCILMYYRVHQLATMMHHT